MTTMVFCRGCGKQIHETAPMCPGCADARGANTLAGRVQWTEKLGDTTFAHVVCAAQPNPLVVRLPGEAEIAIGDGIGLRFESTRLHVFDAAGNAAPRSPSS